MGSLVSDRGYGNYEEDLGEQKEADEEEDKYKTQIENKKVAYKVMGINNAMLFRLLYYYIVIKTISNSCHLDIVVTSMLL